MADPRTSFNSITVSITSAGAKAPAVSAAMSEEELLKKLSIMNMTREQFEALSDAEKQKKLAEIEPLLNEKNLGVKGLYVEPQENKTDAVTATNTDEAPVTQTSDVVEPAQQENVLKTDSIPETTPTVSDDAVIKETFRKEKTKTVEEKVQEELAKYDANQLGIKFDIWDRLDTNAEIEGWTDAEREEFVKKYAGEGVDTENFDGNIADAFEYFDNLSDEGNKVLQKIVEEKFYVEEYNEYALSKGMDTITHEEFCELKDSEKENLKISASKNLVNKLEKQVLGISEDRRLRQEEHIEALQKLLDMNEDVLPELARRECQKRLDNINTADAIFKTEETEDGRRISVRRDGRVINTSATEIILGNTISKDEFEKLSPEAKRKKIEEGIREIYSERFPNITSEKDQEALVDALYNELYLNCRDKREYTLLQESLRLVSFGDDPEAYANVRKMLYAKLTSEQKNEYIENLANGGGASLHDENTYSEAAARADFDIFNEELTRRIAESDNQRNRQDAQRMSDEFNRKAILLSPKGIARLGEGRIRHGFANIGSADARSHVRRTAELNGKTLTLVQDIAEISTERGDNVSAISNDFAVNVKTPEQFALYYQTGDKITDASKKAKYGVATDANAAKLSKELSVDPSVVREGRDHLKSYGKELNDDLRAQYEKDLSDNNSNYAARYQKTLLESTMDTDLDSVKEYAASNIYKLDESVRDWAENYTKSLGIESVTNAIRTQPPVDASDNYSATTNTSSTNTTTAPNTTVYVSQIATSTARPVEAVGAVVSENNLQTQEVSKVAKAIEDMKVANKSVADCLDELSSEKPSVQMAFFELLSDTDKKFAIAHMASYNVSLLFELITSGKGASILSLNLPLSARNRVIELMLQSSHKDRVAAKKFITDNHLEAQYPHLFKQERLAEAEETTYSAHNFLG